MLISLLKKEREDGVSTRRKQSAPCLGSELQPPLPSADIKGAPKQKQRLTRYLAKSPIQRPVHNAAVTMATVAGHPRKPLRPLTEFWRPLQKRGFLAAVPLRLWLPGGRRMQRRWGGVER